MKHYYASPHAQRKVLILAYYRSGSTLTGQLFNYSCDFAPDHDWGLMSPLRTFLGRVWSDTVPWGFAHGAEGKKVNGTWK